MRISKIVITLMMVSSAFVAETKPGEVYILTGQEKSIDEIVKSDMDKYPDLYKGESFKFYVIKFKRENQIGKRKLSIGDELLFPETKASIEAKSAAKHQLLIGKWQIEEHTEPAISRIKSVDTVTVIEFQDNGEYHRQVEITAELADGSGQNKRTETEHGSWAMEENLIIIKVTKKLGSKTIEQETNYTLILLTENELQVKAYGDPTTYTRLM